MAGNDQIRSGMNNGLYRIVQTVRLAGTNSDCQWLERNQHSQRSAARDGEALSSCRLLLLEEEEVVVEIWACT